MHLSVATVSLCVCSIAFIAIGDAHAETNEPTNTPTAQSGPATSSAPLVTQAAQSNSEDELAEIIVTATKRESTVQSTPISITAVSGGEIQERGLTSFSEVAQSVPGLSMKTYGPGQTEFEMRGLASTGGNSPTVGFYLDDTPLTAPGNSSNGKVVIDPNLYDINRVEVLRGPQGTLYGSSSMGGTIKLIPNAPDVTAFASSVQTIFSDTDGGGFNHDENAMVNLPFAAGTAALRIVGSAAHESGWLDRIVIANGDFPLETGNNTVRGNVLAAPVAATYRGVNDEDLKGVRVSLLWRPTDRLSLTPSFFYQDISQNGPNYIDSDPGTNAHYQPFDVSEPFSDQFRLSSLRFQYHFDPFDLTSTTSYWNRDERINQDAAEQLQWALGLASFYPSQGGIGPAIPNFGGVQSKQTSEELRLTSNGASPFQWLLGYFYSDFSSAYGLQVEAPGAAPLLGTGNLFSGLQPIKIIQQSVFGELSYQLTSGLKATLGARRYSYQESISTASSGALSSTGSDTYSYSSAAERNQGLNPKLTLSYQAGNDLLLYATLAKGFRPGGGNFPIPTSGPLGSVCEANLQADYARTAFVASPIEYGPDHVWNYELGEKLRALDNRLTLNSAVYFENWAGVQQDITLPCGYAYEANAGDAHIYGAELEINAVVVKGLVLSTNVGYTHATLVSSNVLNAGVNPGDPLQEVPDWTSSVSLAYRRGISNELAFTARIEGDYVGPRTDATYAINHLPPYTLASLRTGIEGDRWSAVLFAKNLFNERARLDDVNRISPNVPTYDRVVVSQPLTLGIDLSYHFGQ
jgi:outer membrane receptor protein involved in Fe transport